MPLLETVLEQATDSLYRSAVQARADEQFDLLAITTRGFHALAESYGNDLEINQEIVNVRDNLFQILGLESSQPNETIQLLNTDHPQYESLKRNFIQPGTMEFIEKDIDIGQRRPDESRLEKRLKDQLNETLEQYQEIVKSGKENEAEKVFKHKIQPLWVELKAAQANKKFAVMAAQMGKIIKSSEGDPNLNANMVVFLGMTRETLSKMTKIGIIADLAFPSLKQMTREIIKGATEEEKKPSQVDKLVAKVTKKAMSEIGPKVVGLVSEPKAMLEENVQHMKRHAKLVIPSNLAEENIHPKTFDEYFKEVQPTPNATPEERSETPTSFIDFVNRFQQAKGVVGKVESFMQLYKALTTEDEAAILHEGSDLGDAFEQMLKDALMGKQLENLKNACLALGAMKEAGISLNEDWEDILESSKHVLGKMEKLNTEDFQNLLTLHQEKSQIYKALSSQGKKAQKERDEAASALLKTLSEIKSKEERFKKKQAQLVDSEKTKEIGDKYDKSIDEEGKRLSEMQRENAEKVDESAREANAKRDRKIRHITDNSDDRVIEFVEKRMQVIKKYSDIRMKLQDADDRRKFLSDYPEVNNQVEEYKNALMNAARDKAKNKITEFVKKRQAATRSNEKTHQSKIAKLEKQRDHELETLAQKAGERAQESAHEFDKKIAEYRNKAALQNEGLAFKSKALSDLTVQRDEATRSVFKAIQKFKREKESIAKDGERLLNEIAGGTSEEPQLKQLSHLVAIANGDLEPLMIAQFAVQSAIDQASLMTMSVEDVLTPAGPRVKKAMPIAADKKGTGEKILHKGMEMGVGTIVDLVAGDSANTLKQYSACVGATAQAEAKMAEEQKRVNLKAAEKMSEGERKDFLKNLESKPSKKKRPALKRLFSKIGALFKSMARWLKGKPKEVSRAKEEEAVTSVVSTAGLLPAAQQFSEHAALLGDRQKGFTPGHKRNLSKESVSTEDTHPKKSHKRKKMGGGRTGRKDGT